MALRLRFWRREAEDFSGEQHKQPGLLSDFILGSQDGIHHIVPEALLQQDIAQAFNNEIQAVSLAFSSG